MDEHHYGLMEGKGLRLINYTENHQKYWEIRYDSKKKLLIREWGRIGNVPQRKEETKGRFEAFRIADKLVYEKYEKGYRTEGENLQFLLNKS